MEQQMGVTSRLAKAFGSMMLSAAQRQHIQQIRLDDAGHGWDRFGASPQGVAVALSIARLLYDYYFRVSSYGAHQIPAQGPVLVVANHSGTLPLDGIMLWADIVLHTRPPRLPRPIADYFVPALPFVSTLFARAGMVSGSRGNVHALLERGELLELFPEGIHGIGKPFSQRYQLQRWSVGHAELAIRHRAPIVPVGIVGAEEQWPQLAKVDSIRSFGIPYLPVPATPLPLPVHYHIHYGAPIDLCRDFDRSDIEDPKTLAQAAGVVQAAVQALLERGLDSRPGVFV